MFLEECHYSLAYLYPMMLDVTWTRVYVGGVHVHMCTMCTHMSVEARRQPQMSSLGLRSCFVFLKAPQADSAIWLQESASLCLSSAWDCKHA